MADFTEYTGPSADWIALEAALPPPVDGLSPADLKRIVNEGRETAAAKEMIHQSFQSKVTMKDHIIPTRDGCSIEARSYRFSSPCSSSSQPLPVYIHLHGGGFFFGTLSSEDANCSRIVTNLESRNTPVVVVNVNYRHTPEHKYPVAWDDTEDAFHWVHDHLGEIGGDGERVILGGISAGSWLAASMTLAQHLGLDKSLTSRPKIKGQVLMIPALVHGNCYDPQLKYLKDPKVSSFVDNEFAPVLPVSRIEEFDERLAAPASKATENDKRLNPGNVTAEEVKGLPPTTLGVAGMDPLRDQGLLYGKMLSENGVPTDVHVYPGVPHGFRRFGDKLSACKRWDETIFEGIKWTLADPVATGIFEIKAD